MAEPQPADRASQDRAPRSPGLVPVRYLVWGWLCALAAIFYLQRTAFGPAESTIRAELNLTKEQMGLVQGGFFLAYSYLQLPAGWLCQRWGCRLTMSILCVLGSLACGMTGWSATLLGLLIWRAVAGIAQAGAFPGIAETLSVWATGSRRATASGLVAAAMQVGAIIATFYTPQLIKWVGWRQTLWILALPGIVWAVGFAWWYRNHPREHGWVSDDELTLLTAGANPRPAASLKWSVLWQGLKQPVFLLLCGQQFFRAAGYVFFGTWFSTYLQETFSVSKEAAGLLTSWTLVGALGGALVGGYLPDQLAGWLGDVMRSRRCVAIAGQLLCAACIVVAYLGGKDVNWVVAWITVGSFCASAGGPAAYAATIDLAGPNVGPLFGVMNMSGNLGAAAFPIVVPYLLGPEQNDWNLVIGLFAVIYLIAGTMWFGIRAPRPLPGDVG